MEKYKYLIVPIITLMLCQFIKFIIESYKKGTWDFKRLFSGSGGMPSSHTALSTSLFVMILLNDPSSIEAGIMLVVTMIVAYDGMNVRLETGRQAQTINTLVESIFRNNKYNKLKEEMGHKPKEVFFGIILGILVALIYNFAIL